jgi:hypothetical protein
MIAFQAISVVEFLAYLLAVFGVSVTVSTLDGPFAVCSTLRRWLHRTFRSGDHQWIAKGIACPICVSFWVSAVFSFILFTGRGLRLVDLLVIWFSGVGATAAVVWLSPPSDSGDDGYAPPGLPGDTLGTPLPGGVHSGAVR